MFEQQVGEILARQIALHSQAVFGFDAEPTPSELYVAANLAPRIAAAIQEVAQFAYDRGLVNAVGSDGRHGFAKDGGWDSVALTALEGVAPRHSGNP